MRFTQTQIETLRSEYAKINTVDPEGAGYKGICKLLNALNQDDLKMIAKANIKFISRLAINRIAKGNNQ